MPRKPREEVAGGVFHVFARGDDRRPIFIKQFDHDLYTSILARVIGITDWRCMSYCFMPNHLHMLIETPEPNLGAGMQRLQSEFAFRWNAEHDRVGHVFQGRYGAERAKDDPQFWWAVRYVARNPVEAGLCSHPSHWRWSSHRGVLDGTAPAWIDRRRLLELLSGGVGDPLERYLRLTEG
jgi:REP element-mobilizing transposase RayT